ncbi:hypothetical protein [Magnetofaba australis]|uniref:Uncharacterized protein n=1 Tax=Magnetofaba australis IT-1 TaxID=1434232 RepID=A0A1Y2K7X9_9PROT|nr:hypothetical protein [Magnetofaba australis]OSM06749.1 hypothetical protein MAIT1_00396 [Magnetofaba australis IT-1]
MTAYRISIHAGAVTLLGLLFWLSGSPPELDLSLGTLIALAILYGLGWVASLMAIFLILICWDALAGDHWSS